MLTWWGRWWTTSRGWAASYKYTYPYLERMMPMTRTSSSVCCTHSHWLLSSFEKTPSSTSHSRASSSSLSSVLTMSYYRAPVEDATSWLSSPSSMRTFHARDGSWTNTTCFPRWRTPFWRTTLSSRNCSPWRSSTELFATWPPRACFSLPRSSRSIVCWRRWHSSSRRVRSSYSWSSWKWPWCGSEKKTPRPLRPHSLKLPIDPTPQSSLIKPVILSASNPMPDCSFRLAHLFDTNKVI